MSTPESFSNRGVALLTQWAQITEQLIDYAAVFEARGGAGAFEAAKFVAPEGQELTPEQVAANAALDAQAAAALDVVTHHNELMQWYDAGRKVRVAIRRTDY